MGWQKVIRVYSPDIDPEEKTLKDLNRYLFHGWRIVSKETHKYKNGTFTDYLLDD